MMPRLLLLIHLVVPPAVAAGQQPQGPAFGAPRIIRLDADTRTPVCADLDGDGLNDLAVVNNDRARIDLLLQRHEPTSGDEPPGKLNIPRDDPLFEKRKLLTEQHISDLVAADLNGDGRTDLAWHGEPRALVVAFQGEDGTFKERREMEIEDSLLQPHTLQAPDLEGDGDADLVLLARGALVLIRQGSGGLEPPQRIPAGIEERGRATTLDADGDGLEDLILQESGDARRLLLRRQQAGGGYGPEEPFQVPALRSHHPLGNGLVVVQRVSGALRTLRLAPAAGDDLEPLGPPLVYPFGGSRVRASDTAVGDLDGDGVPEILVADPQGARVLVFRRGPGKTLVGPDGFPSLEGVSSLDTGDLDGDGQDEVVVTSRAEKAAGVMAWKGKRLSLPHALPLPGEPQAAAAEDLDGDGRAELLLVAAGEKGPALHVRRTAKTGDGNEETVLSLPPKTRVEGLLAGDLDADGITDLLLFRSYDPPLVFLGTGKNGFREAGTEALYARVNPGNLKPRDALITDLKADGSTELLHVKANFARAIRIQEGAFTLTEQINAPARAEIRHAAVLDTDGDGTPEVVLHDGNEEILRLMSRSASGVFEEQATRKVEGYELLDIRVGGFTGRDRGEILLCGARKLGLVPVGGRSLEARLEDPWESPEEDAFLTHLTTADLTGDGKPELVVVDGGTNSLEILGQEEDGWKRLTRWRVYQEKSYESGSSGAQEPHSVLVAEVTGDGRPDVVLLVHDRLLVYPRE